MMNACACLGPQKGQPYCPCEMAKRVPGYRLYSEQEQEERDKGLKEAIEKAIKEGKL